MILCAIKVSQILTLRTIEVKEKLSVFFPLRIAVGTVCRVPVPLPDHNQHEACPTWYLNLVGKYTDKSVTIQQNIIYYILLIYTQSC